MRSWRRLFIYYELMFFENIVITTVKYFLAVQNTNNTYTVLLRINV